MREWADGFVWTGSSYELELVAADGVSRRAGPPSMLAEPTVLGRIDCRNPMKICFLDLVPTDPGLHLVANGWATTWPTNHTVYEFKVDGKLYHVAAATILRALLRPFGVLIDALLRPQGVEVLALYNMQSPRSEVSFQHNATNVYLGTSRCTLGLAAIFKWLLAFPSGATMAGSFLQNARNGRIAFDLPRAEVAFSVHAIELHGVHHVFSISFRTLDAIEPAWEFARDCPRHFRLYGSRGSAQGRDIDMPSTLRSKNGWEISEAEWARLQPLMHPKRGDWHRRHDHRLTLSAILKKVVTRATWPIVAGDLLSPATLRETYRHMCRDGRWTFFCQELDRIRSELSGQV